jgi:hypothetical protein
VDRVRHGKVVVLGRDEQLLQKQRVAGCRAEDRRTALGRDGPGNKVVEEVGGALRRQCVEQDRRAAHPAAPIGSRGQELGPGEHDQEDRCARERRDVLDEIEHRRRRVVQVLEDEDDRSLACKRLEQPADSPRRFLARPKRFRLAGRGGDALGDRLGIGLPGEHAGGPGADPPSRQHGERIAQRRVRRRVAVGRRLSHRARRCPGEDVDDLPREASLSDARRAEHRDESRLFGRRRELERGEELAELVGAAHERRLEPARDRLRVGEHALHAARHGSRHDGVLDEAQRPLARQHVSVHRTREQAVGFLERRARDERTPARRVARDDVPCRDSCTGDDAGRAKIARGAHAAKRVVLARGRHTEDRDDAVVHRLVDAAAVCLDRCGGVGTCASKLFAARLGILRVGAEVGEQHRHRLPTLLDRRCARDGRRRRSVERRILPENGAL